MIQPTNDPRRVRDEDFPEHGTIEEKLQFLLSFAVLAPSTHNSQPWFFRIVDNAIELHADWSRRLEVADPNGRELVMSCGAALLNLELAFHHFSVEPEIEILPDETSATLMARIYPGKPYLESTEEQRVFEAIASRRTNRLPFTHDRLPGQLINELEDLPRRYGVELCILRQGTEQNGIAELIGAAERILFTSKAYRDERAEWIHGRKDDRHDGMSLRVLGHPYAGDWMTPIATAAVRAIDSGVARGQWCTELAREAPLLAVLATKGDAPADWIAAGRTIAHLLLLASSWGATASFFNQVIQLETVRPHLQWLVECRGTPQLVFRMGYAVATEPTPRRPVVEVMLRELCPVDAMNAKA